MRRGWRESDNYVDKYLTIIVKYLFTKIKFCTMLVVTILKIKGIGDGFMRISQEKLKRLSKIMVTVFNVFFWVGAAAEIIGIIVFTATFFIPESVFAFQKQGGSGGLTVNGIIKFAVDPALNQSVSIKPLLQALLPVALIASLLLVIVIHQVRCIVKTVADDCPFHRKNSSRLCIIAAILIVGSITVNVAEARLARLIIDALKIQNVSVNYTINSTMFLSGFLIFILAGVFRYGSYLQEEYDATL